MGDGVVYFIQGIGGGPIKIGYTTDTRGRYSSLQIGNPERLMLLCEFSAVPRDESKLHARFAGHHVRGEWFAPAPEILEFVRQNAIGFERRTITSDLTHRVCTPTVVEERAALSEAINAIKGAELARQLGISRAAIAQWKRVPARRVIEVERISGVSRHRLRPDLYPSPQVEATA